MHLLEKGSRELMAKVNLGQTRASRVSESNTPQLYWNTQVSQDKKVLFVWSKKGTIPNNWISKLE